MVLSNCRIDAASITPTYRKPFGLIFARAKNEEWRALEDDFSHHGVTGPDARCVGYIVS
jgi:hypothetical protein